MCFILHLLIGLISSKEYWRKAKKLMTVLKGVIQITVYFYEILTQIQTKEEGLNFLNRKKTRSQENFHFRWLSVSLTKQSCMRQ